jgi:hypothetical protein
VSAAVAYGLLADQQAVVSPVYGKSVGCSWATAALTGLGRLTGVASGGSAAKGALLFVEIYVIVDRPARAAGGLDLTATADGGLNLAARAEAGYNEEAAMEAVLELTATAEEVVE